MKEELLKEFTEKMLKYIENTEAFLSSQTPEYIKELLSYGVYESVINISAILVGTGIGVIPLIVATYLFKTRKSKGDETFVPFLIVSVIIIAIGTMVFLDVGVTNIKKIIKIKTAPKVFIIDHLRGKE